MKLDCKHVWEHISGYIDNTVDAKLREEIERHLEHCEICSAILDSTSQVVGAIERRVFSVNGALFQLHKD